MTAFRKMRRFRQQIPEEECIALLQETEYGILAVQGDDDYPYTVPVNHVYENGRLYIHSAVAGHKIDAILKQEKVSFCVVGKSDLIPEMLDTHYVSVVCFGRARIVKDAEEKRRIGALLGERFSGQYPDKVKEAIDRQIKVFDCIEIEIDHMTGKESKDLMKQREG